MSQQDPRQKQKPRFIWDYLRKGQGGGFSNPFGFITNHNSPENLRKRLEALKLKQELKRQKQSPEERRVAA